MRGRLHQINGCVSGLAGETEFGLCAFLIFVISQLNPSMNNTFKPVWSRQHGAYITLITSWLAGTLLSEHIYPIHFVILVMLLAGFNFTEFTQDRFLRNSPPSPQKRFWTWMYFALAVTSGICVIINVTKFKFILPIIVIAALIFILLTKLKLHKSILSEFFMFAVISLVGLISFNPHNFSSFSNLFPLWLIDVSLFFFYNISCENQI